MYAVVQVRCLVIKCPNPNCNIDNPEAAVACQACSSALPHYYLWGIGETLATLKPGAVLSDRYLLKRDRIFLDTKPGLVPEAPVEISKAALPYLRLSVYPLHVPRLYAAFETADGDQVLMLESSAFSMAVSTDLETSIPRLLPLLVSNWAEAPPLRQLSWLWQIAQMWEGFQDEQVAPTLLNDELVRVDGSVVRLLELTANLDRLDLAQSGTGAPTLVSLANSWEPLATTAHPSVRAFLTELCDRLEQGQFTGEALCEQLELAITTCAKDQGIAYDLAVYTDQGPTRNRNEDACFPENGTSLSLTSEQTTAAPQLLIVCDGIGGHQGGDIASKLAIATIRAELAPLLSSDSANADLSSSEITLAIEQAICAANDEISAQNDQAQRQARERMGTTLVLALVRGAEVYIAHLGDSRAYRIGQHNCQQVTLDDDVASKQVCLGGSLYREMLIHPGAGSLVQALGMGPSQMLRPTVQRLVLDENCVFLLCSDGLSDSDRVEQFWMSVLKPLVNRESKVDIVAQQLVSLANKYNGHDNVTVGLLAGQVLHTSERMLPRTLAPLPKAVSPPGETVVLSQAHASQTQLELPPTKRLKPRTVSSKAPSETSPLAGAAPTRTAGRLTRQKLGLIILLLAVFAALAYAILPGLRGRLLPASPNEQPADTGGADAEQSLLPVPDSPIATLDLAVGNYLRLRQLDGVGIRSTSVGTENDSDAALSDSSQLLLYPKPVVLANGVAEDVIPGTISTGGIVRILNKQTAETQGAWVQLEVCSIPSGADLTEVPVETDTPEASNRPPDGSLNRPESTEVDQPLFLPPGSRGWALEVQLGRLAEPITDLQSEQIGSCG